MKLVLGNWHLNARIWHLNCRRLAFIKLTPGCCRYYSAMFPPVLSKGPRIRGLLGGGRPGDGRPGAGGAGGGLFGGLGGGRRPAGNAAGGSPGIEP